MLVNIMMLALKSGPQIAAKTGNPAGLLFRRIWYSVGKSGKLGITEYRQGRPLHPPIDDLHFNGHANRCDMELCFRRIFGTIELFCNITGATYTDELINIVVY